MLIILAVSLLWWVNGQTDGQVDQGAAPTSAQTRTGGSPSTADVTDPESGLAWVALTDLPVQAARTVGLIDGGGPFPYGKDGSVFGNNERLLPRQRSGYYREYTVPTPGESDRGARRIVRGQAGQLYWTGDHYLSFQRIRR